MKLRTWTTFRPYITNLIRVLLIVAILLCLIVTTVDQVEGRPLAFSRLKTAFASSASSWDVISGVSFDTAYNRIVIGTGGYLKKTFYGRQFRMGLLGASGQPQSLILTINGHSTSCTSSYPIYVSCNSYIMPTDGWYTVTVSKAGDGAYAWGVGSSATGWLYYEIWGEGDSTPPVQTVSYSTTGWTNGDVTVTMQASDPESGLNVNQYRFMSDSSGVWGAWTNCGAGTCAAVITENGQIEHYSSNRLGGITRTYPRVDNIDKAAPLAISPADVSPPAAFPHDTWVTAGGLAAWDWPDMSDSGSGLDGYRVYFGDDPAGSSAEVQGNSDYSTDITTDGIYYLRSQVVDLTGNTSLWTNLYTVRLDGTNPDALLTANGGTAWDNSTWFNSDTTLGLQTTDNLSGVNLSQFRIDGGSWVNTAFMNSDGIYSIDYQAEDVAGNTISETRTFRLDKTPPELVSSIPIVDGTNGWYVAAPTIAVSGSDTLSGLSAEEISLDGGGSWGASSQTLFDGTYSVVMRTRDAAGNITSENHTLKVDTTAPAFSTSLSGTNGNTGWFTFDVTIQHAYSDATSGLALSQMNVNSGGWQSIVDQSFSDGVYSIEYALQDEAGNLTSVTENLQIDTIPPTRSVNIPAANGNNGWYKTQPTIEVSGTDSGSGLDSAALSLDGGVTWIPDKTTLADGIHSVIFRVTDVAGNQTQETRIVKVDTTDPTIVETLTGTNGSGGWYTSNVVVNAVTGDTSSGVIGEEMRVDNGAWTPIGSTTLKDGPHTVEYRAEDEAGNIVSRTVTVNVDTTAPAANISTTGVMGSNGWYTTEVRLDLSTSDATSGVALTEVQTDSFWQPTDGSITLTDGTYEVRFRVTDSAGNITLTPPVTYRVDTTPPDMTLALQGSVNASGWSNGTIKLIGSAADDGSGLLAFEVNINNAGWVDATTADLSFEQEGVYEILCRATDTAGNTTEELIMVRIDKTPPKSRFVNPPEGTTVTATQGTVVLIGASTDNLSGVESAEISLDNGLTWQSLDSPSPWAYTWDTTTVPDGFYIVLARAVDQAGNHEHTAQVTLVVENDRPIIEVPSSWYIWEDAPLRVYSDEKIKEISIRISDSADRWEYYVEYDGSSIPLYVRWNRIFGFDSEGRSIHAPPGEYLVEIIAKNEHNRETVVHSTIIIPDGGSSGVLLQAGLDAAEMNMTILPESYSEMNENFLENSSVSEYQEEETQGSESAVSSEASDLTASQAEVGNDTQWQNADQLWKPLLGLLLILLGGLLVFLLWVYKRRLEGQEERA